MTDRRSLLAAIAAGTLLTPAKAAFAAEACAAADDAIKSALLDRYVAAANAHDTSTFPEIFTENYQQHSGRSANGLAAQIENARRGYAAMPDRRLVIEDRIFGGDRIVARCTYSGTQKGTFFGVAPTGKSISFGTIDIWRVEGGKLAEHWDMVDVAGIMRQLQSS